VGYVFHILFALGSLAVLDLGWASTVERVWAVPLGVFVPYALGWAARVPRRALPHRRPERLLPSLPVAAARRRARPRLGGDRRCAAAAVDPDWLGFGVLAALAPFFVYQVAAIDARARCPAFGSGRQRRAPSSSVLRPPCRSWCIWRAPA
jgi:hypothetical protein